MKGVVWHGPYDVRVEEDLHLPRVIEPRDAVIQVTLTAICGTDLHPYRGEIPDFRPGTVMGHEFTGVVQDVGTAIKGLRPGDRVLVSDLIACGECWFCRRGWHYQCKNVSLFGYGTVVGDYVPGGQAEYVRVPYADVVLSKIPDSLTDEQALFIGDIFTTGYTCAYEAGITPGDTAAVVGCGPVGLFALMTAHLMGVSRVFAIDTNASRRAFAKKLGGYPLVPDDKLVDQIRDLTHGRGVDAALEAVGSDSALETCLTIVRPKGIISAVGSHHSEEMPFPTGLAFARELTLRFSVGDPISLRERLIPLVETGRIDPTCIISHRLPLAEAVEGYRLFDQHEAIKVVLTP